MNKTEEKRKILEDYDVLRLTGDEIIVEICQIFESKENIAKGEIRCPECGMIYKDGKPT